MNDVEDLMRWLHALERSLSAAKHGKTARDRWGGRFCAKWDRRRIVEIIKRIRGIA